MKISAVLASAFLCGSVLAGTATARAITAAQTTEVAQFATMAHSAQAAIAANPKDMSAMQSAIAVRSVSQASAVLEEHGFTAAQLEQGVMVFSHQILPKKVRRHQFYYMEIDPKPFKISVHGLPSM